MMKRFSDQNYYEILEVSYSATWAAIQKAYELAKMTYSKDSIASYSLFDPDDREIILDRIEEAHRILSDDEKRRRYNQRLVHDAPELADQITAGERDSAPADLNDTVRLSNEVNGEILKKIRENRGVSLEEIAELTRITMSYLKFIEEENFKSLPAEVYLRGYLHQYADLLHLDPKLVVDGYMKGYQRWRKENGMEDD
ncbi:MAG: helix-turn-helix domain-containing protein [Nitrospiria bacterium]